MLPYLAQPKRSKLRASDLDRHQTVEFLSQHAGEGRLTTEELEDRIEQAYGAKTIGDLVALTADLPADPRAAMTLRGPVQISAEPGRKFRYKLVRQVRRWATIDLAAVLTWMFTGQGRFWPAYVILVSLLAILFRVSRYLERGYLERARRQAAQTTR